MQSIGQCQDNQHWHDWDREASTYQKHLHSLSHKKKTLEELFIMRGWVSGENSEFTEYKCVDKNTKQGDNHGHLLADISAVRSSLMTGLPLGCDASEKKQGV